MTAADLVAAGRLDPLDPAVAFELWKETADTKTWLGVNSRTAWIRATQWVTTTQNQWGDLTLGAALNELTKGETSIFYPVFRAEPWVPADCPSCRHRVTVDARLICPACGHTFQEQQ